MDSPGGAGAGSGRKKGKPSDLTDIVFSWSLQEIFNSNLYRDKVLFFLSLFPFLFSPLFWAMFTVLIMVSYDHQFKFNACQLENVLNDVGSLLFRNVSFASLAM
ncbi:hypothetical protein BT93_L3983 [Corymbia citriodora subsp. variegata]|uniref:Uncharacterized protein n=1 Tax=Corymbia citriodora subsp. variegata TaxID=360336 RepID=A0A8T0CIK1_CORYI|nr:hypothetical protein BT93_L3983 [Corymbia citriodora subsp. variegata]